MLIGSLRGRPSRRRLRELENDILSLDDRVNREIKRRAGSTKERQPMPEEVQQLLREATAKSNSQLTLPGRSRVSHVE